MKRPRKETRAAGSGLRPQRPGTPRARAFTLIEVMVALAIVAIGAAALLRLQLVSIVMTDRASRTTAAALLLDAVLDEAISDPDPEVGVSEGRFEEPWGHGMAWRVAVSEARIPGLEGEAARRLLEVRAQVWWDDALPEHGVEGVVYVAP